MDSAGIRALEEIADRAWPARETIRGDCWEARFSDGMHRRLNSATVWSADDVPGLASRIEEWYRERGQTAIFKLTRVAAPGLEDLLAGRGYVPDARVGIMTAPLRRKAGPPPGVGVDEKPSPEWSEAFASMSGYGPDRRRLLAEVLGRISRPAGYASITEGREIVSVGMAVAEGDHAGVFEMITHPDHRGRGHGTAVLDALLAWSAAAGAGTAYLQVLEGNLPAERIYGRAGFAPRYHYWYRVRPGWLSATPR